MSLAFLNAFKQKVFPMFCRVPMQVRVTDALYQTDIDLLSAAYNAEEWCARRDMLTQRKERLIRLRNMIENTDQVTVRISRDKILDAFSNASL